MKLQLCLFWQGCRDRVENTLQELTRAKNSKYQLTDQAFHFIYALWADLLKPNMPQTVPDTSKLFLPWKQLVKLRSENSSRSISTSSVWDGFGFGMVKEFRMVLGKTQGYCTTSGAAPWKGGTPWDLRWWENWSGLGAVTGIGAVLLFIFSQR